MTNYTLTRKPEILFQIFTCFSELPQEASIVPSGLNRRQEDRPAFRMVSSNCPAHEENIKMDVPDATVDLMNVVMESVT